MTNIIGSNERFDRLIVRVSEMFYNMKRNTKIKDYFAAKSRKSESSGIMDDVCMAFCLFCILRVGTDDVLTGSVISAGPIHDLRWVKVLAHFEISA
jgi:hypothetical protein